MIKGTGGLWKLRSAFERGKAGVRVSAMLISFLKKLYI